MTLNSRFALDGDADAGTDRIQFQEDQRPLQLATMTEDERFDDFLKRCITRGSRYKPGRSLFPNVCQLAIYCQCCPSTIYRIVKGETKSPSPKTMRILWAMSCADLQVTAGQRRDERLERLRDADRWVKADPKTRGEIMDVIQLGIHARRKAGLE